MKQSYEKKGDLGNGYYMNPILGGDYPDPSVLRVGNDYYMTHSTFKCGPSLLIWHSQDLVNWEPLCNALEGYGGDIWAPDFIKHGDSYYIYYFKANEGNWVITAQSPAGPWSKPFALDVGWIDPGHVVDHATGKRYLHVSDGHMVELSDDGLSVVGEAKKVYDGWKYPEEWDAEGFYLESPKLFYRDGYYYLTSAEGGTAGPATSHMVVSSRSRTPWGPWEHSPYNPIVHTYSREERWWSRGHGTLVDAPDGTWWILYHAYEKDFHTLGRQTLLEPIEWTDDGWFRVPEGITPDKPIQKPRGNAVNGKLELSDNFKSGQLGFQWRFFDEFDPERISFGTLGLTMKGKGDLPVNCSPMLCIPSDRSYQAEVSLTVEHAAEGGLLVFYNPECYCGIGFSGGQVITHDKKWKSGKDIEVEGKQIWLRLINREHTVSLYYSMDNATWSKLEYSCETSGYNHNVFGGFMSLRLGVYASGEGHVTFGYFKYEALGYR